MISYILKFTYPPYTGYETYRDYGMQFEEDTEEEALIFIERFLIDNGFTKTSDGTWFCKESGAKCNVVKE